MVAPLRKDGEPLGDGAARVRINVDIERALKVLSGSVFAGRNEAIRELIANAADSITELPPALRKHLEIRLVPRRPSEADEGPMLHVSDTGVGMTKEQVQERLGKIFYSSKHRSTDTIGRFGIGFYSCFPLCSRIEILTRTHDEMDQGTRLIYSGGEEISVQPWPVTCPGTLVILHLLPEHKTLVERSTLRNIVVRYCDFIPYPIYVGDGCDILNRMSAPWYKTEACEPEIAKSIEEVCGSPAPLIVVSVNGLDDLRGVLFVLPGSQRTVLRLYSQRVMVTDTDTRLLGEEFCPFLSGIVDLGNQPLVLSRDAFVADHPRLKGVRDCLIRCLADGLSRIARSQQIDFRRLMTEHGPAIKLACQRHPVLRESLRDHFPYRSSLRPFVTMPEYLSQQVENRVIYADDMSLATPLLPLYNKANIEVLLMTDPVDDQLRMDWSIDGKLVTFQRLDLDPPAVSDREYAPACSELVFDLAKELFRSVARPGLGFEIRSLGTDAPPAILAIPEESRQQLQFAEAIKVFQKEGRLGELEPELQEMVKAGEVDLLGQAAHQTLILNHSNDVVQYLLRKLREPMDAIDQNVASMLGRFLYSQALLSSGLPLSSDRLTDISKAQSQLISILLQAHDSTKTETSR
jgi:molecular chaperone HtpG